MMTDSPMFDFLSQLFDTTGFPARWQCGTWSDGHGWLHILSDLGVWSAYFAIPCILVYFVVNRRDIPFPTIFWLFGAFILACGTTHLMEAIIFWKPLYRLAGVIKLATALISWGTVVALVPIIPKALTMRSPEELEREIAARKVAEDALQHTNADLEKRVQERTAELAQANTSLRQQDERLSTELEAMTRLHALSTRLFSTGRVEAALADVLENAIVTCGAALGNIQLYNPQLGGLEIIAQRGFMPDFLDHFRLVRVDEGSACAQAMQRGERSIIEDVELDATYARHRAVAKAAGYRAVQSTPLKGHDGKILGMLSTHFRAPHRPSDRDLRLLDLYARHAADLVERNRFEQALRDADRRKDEFVATLAHELRNPLAPIRNAVQVLRIKKVSDPELCSARDIVDRQVQQMARLVDDLLDVSRITRGKVQLRKERIELSNAVRSAVEAVRPLIDAQAHQLTVTLPSAPVHLHADPIRLAQIFSNLLHNAAKFTEKGGHIWLTVEPQRDVVVVSVRDTGIGIAAEHLPHLFNMFSQVVPALQRSQGGLGIGLALVKGLVELHGGNVEVRSAGSGKGSEFTVRLPADETQEKTEAESDGEAEKTTTQPKCCILVADDLRDTAESLAMMLRLAGHEVQTANDGLEAVQAAAAFRPDIALLDIGMPKMNGYEAARSIRREPWGKNIVLIAVTGWGQEDDKRRAVEAGFDHHLTKPVSPGALEKLLVAVASSRSR
jgi:signal transduction histidine kinase/ActR/RegA family two-component response regulator